MADHGGHGHYGSVFQGDSECGNAAASGKPRGAVRPPGKPPPPRESRTHIVGECEIYKEERGALEEGKRKLDACDMEEFGRLESSEKTIAILGDRWWPQTVKRDGDRISKQFLYVVYGKGVMSAQLLEVSLLGVGTVLRFGRDAWSMVK